MTPTDLYLRMGMDGKAMRISKSNHVTIRHALRKVLYELDYSKIEIARCEANLTGRKPEHSKVIASLKQDTYAIRRILPQVRNLADELGLTIRVRTPEDVAVAPI